MSFSGEIKEELSENMAKARHCNLAELSAIAQMCGEFSKGKNGDPQLKVHTENFPVARKCFTLMEKTFNIRTDVVVRRNQVKGSWTYLLYWKGEELAAVRNAMVQAVCCKRAYIRGAFLCAGSISDPRKSYHFEIVCGTKEQGEHLKKMIRSFDIEAKITARKNSYVVYLKEGSQIVDILNVMEAHMALMELENVRILKEMRNSVNRKVNCETANINKIVAAAVRQKEDILLIRDRMGLEKLPDALQEMALTRLTCSEDVSLKDLGALMDPPLGKSGVNHRLRKLSVIADKLREQ